MKKKTISLICILFVIVGIFLIDYSSKNALERKVILYRYLYLPYWKLNSAYADDEEKYIHVRFDEKYSHFTKRKENMQKIYSELDDSIFHENSQWKDYDLEIAFVNQGDYFHITSASESVEIRSNTWIPLNQISALFPDATRLLLLPAYYTDIEEIQGFSDLEYIYFSQELTNEEKNIVLSYYPDCIIYDDPIKAGIY